LRACTALLAAALVLAAYRMAPETEPVPVAVAARPVPLDPTDPARDHIGRLRYMGGLELTAADRRFGGLSAMRFLPDGRLLTLSDEGSWIALALREAGDRLTGIGPATLARMPDLTGRPLRARVQSDSEALELDTDGARIVGFQRENRVWRFDPATGRPRMRPFPDAMWLAARPASGGISAIAHVGALWLFLTEDAGTGGYNGVLQGSGGLSATYGRVTYTPPPGFLPTDAAALDAAHVLVLSRRYSPQQGVAAALAIVPVDAARLGLGRPEAVATLEWPLTIDNMEAIDVRHAGGRTFVYIASDDNFSPLQRTLLLKFELMPAPGSAH